MAVVEDPEGNEDAALARADVSFFGRRILEIGCGDGRFTRRYADIADSVIAIDPDADAIAELAADLPRIDARSIAVDQLELPDQSIDVVLFAWSLWWIPIEGMVDALRRAKRVVAANDCIVDLHPTETAAAVKVAEWVIGQVDSEDAPKRHAAAGAALDQSVAAGLCTLVASTEFSFHTYADSIEELRDYVNQTWRSARISEATVQAARKELSASAGGVRPLIVERVRLTTLRPIK